MNLQEVDPLTWVRANAGKFFPDGRVDPVYLVAYLMADVLELSVGDCTIRRRDGWWIVGSTVDWLEGAGFPPAELFRRVVATPGRGEHSMRGEVVVAAFALSVWTALGGSLTAVQGDEPPPGVWGNTKGLRRVIVYKV